MIGMWIKKTRRGKKMRNKTVTGVVALLLVFAFAFAGCKGKQEEKKAATPGALTNVMGGLKIDPDPPVALKETTFTAMLAEKDGKPISGAQVILDLTMPGMDHGENRPKLTETAPGVYMGKGIATMGGQWDARVEVNYKGDMVSRHFPFKVVDK